MSAVADWVDVDLDAAGSSAVEEDRLCRSIVFGPLGDGWHVRQPLAITLEQSDGRFVASDPIFDIYGEGESWDDAVEDYRVALVEYFQIMADGADAATRAVVNHLRTYLEPPQS